MKEGKAKMINFKLTEGIVYRNPKPHVHSRHAYFPSIVCLENGDMLCSFVIGEAFEAVDLDTHLSRSTDGGNTWSDPVPLLPEILKKEASNCARITSLGGGDIVAMVVRNLREEHLEEGLANPDTLGFVPADLFLTRSSDYGRTWDAPQVVHPPLEGPSFEACSPIVILSDGRWIWPTSTWRGWDGYAPNGMKMIALVSRDQGRSWPEYLTVMDGNAQKIIYWEGKVIELKNGNLLSVSWAYNEGKGQDITNQYSLSYDGGRNWIDPASTGICGQTIAVAQLADGSLIVVYRRVDQPGLWAQIFEMEERKWKPIQDFCLWGGNGIDMQKGNNMVADFNALKFGAPSIAQLADESVYIVFWCYEKMVSNIRWIKLSR